MTKGIGQKIKENITFRNWTIKDTAELLSISEKHLSEILNNKQQLTTDISAKLDRVFGFEIGTLLKLQERNKVNNFKDKKEIVQIVDDLQRYSEFKHYDLESLKFHVANMFIIEFSKYEEFLKKRNINFNSYRNKPMGILWFAIMDKLYGSNKASGKFNASNGRSVINQSLEIMFSNDDQKSRLKSLNKLLDNNGIVLATGPFFTNSTMTGASFEDNFSGETFKKGKQRFIFLNDYNKKEYSFIFSLVHELFHVYKMMDGEDNNKVSNYIRKYMKDKDIKHELEYAIKIFGDKNIDKKKQGDLVYKNTNIGINFGDPASLIKKELLSV